MLSISSILDMLVSLKINSTIELFSLYCVTVSLLLKFLIVDNRGSIVTCRTYSLSAVYMGVGSMSNRPNGDAIVSERVALMSEGSEIASPFQIKSDNLTLLPWRCIVNSPDSLPCQSGMDTKTGKKGPYSSLP